MAGTLKVVEQFVRGGHSLVIICGKLQACWIVQALYKSLKAAV